MRVMTRTRRHNSFTIWGLSLRGALAPKQSHPRCEIAALPPVARNDSVFVVCGIASRHASLAAKG
jgi:hypothetical protein